MSPMDMDKLLEQGLSGEPPRPEFREQVLRDSFLALARTRRARARWRAVSRVAAAVVIAGVSFVLGRHSGTPEPQGLPSVPQPAAVKSRGVTVPDELMQWVEAARLFRQLGMEDRMARAVDHASGLLPYDTAAGPVAHGTATPGDESGGNVAAGETAARALAGTNHTGSPHGTILSALGLATAPQEKRLSSVEATNPIRTYSLGD